MSTEEQRIREFAYQIWESEGRPEGHEARHWTMACKLVEAQALAPSKPPRAKAPAAAKAKAPTKVLDKTPTEKKPRAPRKPTAK